MQWNNLTKIIIVISIFILIIIAGCTKKSDPFKNLAVPDYSKKLLSIVDGCTCDILDNSRVVCFCPQPDYPEDIRLICNKAPANIYEAIQECMGITIKRDPPPPKKVFEGRLI